MEDTKARGRSPGLRVPYSPIQDFTMELELKVVQPLPPKFQPAHLSQVGRYALGVAWGDGHNSIFSFDLLRSLCPCKACFEMRQKKQAFPPAAVQPIEVRRLPDQGMVVKWADAHDSAYEAEYLRNLCPCATCSEAVQARHENPLGNPGR